LIGVFDCLKTEAERILPAQVDSIAQKVDMKLQRAYIQFHQAQIDKGDNKEQAITRKAKEDQEKQDRKKEKCR